MDKIDILILLLIVFSILGILIYFKKDVLLEDISNIFNKKEHFSESYNVSDYDVHIGKNLFIGYSSSIESDKERENIQAAAMGKFENQLKNIDLTKGNIFINGQGKSAGNICLGGDTSSGGICMNATNLDLFNDEKYSIPKFIKGRKQVYYNNDQKNVDHNKLCFSEPGTSGEDKCLTDMHFNIMNGNNAIRLNFKNGAGDNYEKIKPYSVEFGQYNGFSNVLVHPFHMPESDYNNAKSIIEGSTNTCYGSGGKQYHSVTNDSGYYGDQYFLRTEARPISSYSHIHEHVDS